MLLTIKPRALPPGQELRRDGTRQVLARELCGTGWCSVNVWLPGRRPPAAGAVGERAPLRREWRRANPIRSDHTTAKGGRYRLSLLAADVGFRASQERAGRREPNTVGSAPGGPVGRRGPLSGRAEHLFAQCADGQAEWAGGVVGGEIVNGICILGRTLPELAAHRPLLANLDSEAKRAGDRDARDAADSSNWKTTVQRRIRPDYMTGLEGAAELSAILLRRAHMTATAPDCRPALN